METDECPKIEKASQKLLDLSYDERVKHFEKEAMSLYQFCLKKGYSEGDIQTCVSKLYDSSKSTTVKALEDSQRSVIVLVLLVGLTGAIYSSPEANNFVAAHYKLFTIKYVLPYWNFGQLWNEDCIVYNKWLPEDKFEINEKTCKYCSNIVKLNNNTLDKYKDFSKSEMSTHYLAFQQPVIVEDATKGWPSTQINMELLSKLYQTHPLLSHSMGSCVYETTVTQTSNFYDFITAYVDKTLQNNWHIRWENCDTKSAKIIRKYYSRLYFIPDSVQSNPTNTIIAARGASPEKHKFIVESSEGRWLTVVSGSMKVYLNPTYPQCKHDYGCDTTVFELNAGQAVFYYPNVWEIDYEIISKDETLAVSTSLVWDQ